jgi:broad specificity phosphatase PhoE
MEVLEKRVMIVKAKYLCPLVVILFAAAIIVIGYYYCGYGLVTTVVIVRHAEKDVTGGTDPPLSVAGTARAAALSHVVESVGVEVIFATEFQRTQASVAPTAAYLGITATVLSKADVEGLVRSITSEHKGKTVLVAGHSDSVPAILQALGISAPPAIAEGVFDNLFVVHVLNSYPRRAKLTHLKYGNPSP